MMILLSKKEYDDLVHRATAIEAQVEERVEVEKANILAKLQKGVQDACNPDLVGYRTHPLDAIKKCIDELLR